MSEVKLFSISSGSVTEIKGDSSDLEKKLQNLIEANLETLLGIRFVASEYSTGKTHGGRIDTLGLDENSCPVILEYKRTTGENVINQGLFYLDWLMDHQAEYAMLVQKKFGSEETEKIDWSEPRLVCIASDFTKYDSHATQQIDRNIELIRYKKFGDGLLLLELVNAVSSRSLSGARTSNNSALKTTDKTAEQSLSELSEPLRLIFNDLETYLMSLGDDVQRKDLKLYVAFKRIKNFVCVVFYKDKLGLHVKLNPEDVLLEEGFSRSLKNIGHWGTGDLEIILKSIGDIEKAKPLLKRAYDGE